MLLAAANYASVNKVTDLGNHILQLKHEAITAINTALQHEPQTVSDGMVGAVAKMASFEAMYGDMASYRLHMEGLCRMLTVRGGMDMLGLGGLLRRIVVWIDVNSSFLLDIPRYFPWATFREDCGVEPNPERFVAA